MNACVDAHRELYNAALQERRDGWAHSQARITYSSQAAQLTDMRLARPDQAQWSYSSQQQTLRRLNKAFDGFFRRVKQAKPGVKPGYPRFKSRNRFDSVLWGKDGDGARWLPDRRRVYLQGIGYVKVELHRPVVGTVKTLQIKKAGRHWNLVLSCDDVPTNPLPATGRNTGIDVGIARYATCSDDTGIDNPRFAKHSADRLAQAQKRLSAAKRGSANRVAKRDTVAARHRKIANQRKDFHHKQARNLVARYDFLAVENLEIKNMLRRAKPKPDPDKPGEFLPNGAAAKTGLNASISDASWGYFLSILRAKAEEAGRVWVEVNPRHTSDGCEKCGHAAKGNRVTQEKFACQRCGHTAPADLHAARNILRAGLALHAQAA